MHPEDMLSVLGSFPIFSIVNFPSSSDSEEFQVNGNEKFKENYAWNQWDDFPFGMILIRGKWFEFKINIKSNKLKINKQLLNGHYCTLLKNIKVKNSL